MNEDVRISKAQRVEDLGRIRERLFFILDETECFNEIFSEEHFIGKYKESRDSEENLYELCHEIEHLKNKLWDVYSIAKGDEYESC